MIIAVIDDHELIREGLNVILRREKDCDVENFSIGTDLVEVMDRGIKFDYYIVDLELPDMDGFDLIKSIRERDPGARIIISTIHDEIWTLRRLLACGVNGIVYKSELGREIITAIESIDSGNRYFCEEVLRTMDIAVDKNLHPSSREMEVLRLIADGKTSREIAEILFVTDNTVEAHRKALFSKLGALNVADLIVKAIERGYIGTENVKY